MLWRSPFFFFVPLGSASLPAQLEILERPRDMRGLHARLFLESADSAVLLGVGGWVSKKTSYGGLCPPVVSFPLSIVESNTFRCAAQPLSQPLRF